MDDIGTAPTAQPSMIDWAERYALMGWPVFPVSMAKVPLTPNGVKDASTDVDRVHAWWGEHPRAGIGFATGRVAAIDLDGDEGVANLATLPPAARVETLMQATGGGGAHLLFAVPPGETVKNSASRLAAKIDVRGHGGYIILAPSMHSSGRRYEWLNWGTPLAPAPEEIINRDSYEPVPIAPANIQRFDGDGTRYGVNALVAEIAHVVAAGKGDRNNALNVAAMNIGSLAGAGHIDLHRAYQRLEDAAAACWQASGEKPPMGEIRKTIESGLKAGVSRPRQGVEVRGSY